MIRRTFLADRAIYGFGAVALLLALVLPGLIPAFASAAQLSSRGIKISNSAGGAPGVSYEVSFTASASFQSFVVDVCSDSPIIGQTCAATPGFDWGTPTVTGDSPASALGTITATKVGTTTLKVSGSASVAAGAATFTVTGVHNPTAVGSFYARITTYTDAAFGGGSPYAGPASVGNSVDDGGIALSTTDSVGVTAAVREKLTFCVSGLAPGSGCGTTGQAVTLPSLELGEGSIPKALDANAVSTGQVWTQISTNASGGAIVRMSNSNTQCGGLHRAGAALNTCEIGPMGGDGGGAAALALNAGSPLFGMRLGTPAAVGTGSGTLTPQAPYNGAAGSYGMQFKSDDSVGVTSAYGDPIYTTTGAPADDMNYDLNFAASINNSTPAGMYSANMNLVATGTF